MSKGKNNRKDPAYIREQGKLATREAKKRNITFSLSKHIENQGQSIKDWGDSGLLEIFLTRLKFLGQYSALEVRQKQYIKEYTKVDFPPDSEFTPPKHIVGVTWAVMHIRSKSKEVVVGYIDDDENVFYIVFLDKEHKFWPSCLKNT